MSGASINRGTLASNPKRGAETDAEFTGTLNVSGRDYWLSGWVMEGDGGRFFSLTVEPQEGDDKRTIQRFKHSARDHFGPLPEDAPF